MKQDENDSREEEEYITLDLKKFLKVDSAESKKNNPVVIVK